VIIIYVIGSQIAAFRSWARDGIEFPATGFVRADSIHVNATKLLAGQVYTTENGVICVGYTNWPAHMAKTASTTFGNNVTKFLLSLEKEGELYVLYRGALMQDSVCR